MPKVTAYLDEKTHEKYKQLPVEEKAGLIRRLLKKYFERRKKI